MRRRISMLAAAAALAAVAAVPGSTSAGAQVVTCLGEVATIVGSPGDDVLGGTTGDDVIVALGGDDVIRGLGGDDLICAGSGDDVVIAGRGDDIVLAGVGTDRVRGGAGTDTIRSGPGPDVLNGGRGWDDCFPGRGDDRRVRCEEHPVAAPDGQLGGADIGDEAEDAIERMIDTLGTPRDDSGWVVGCELDDPEEINERLVQWGSLRAHFYGAEGDRSFIGWSYGLIDGAARPGGPAAADVRLPEGLAMLDSLQDAADALGIAAQEDVIFGWYSVFVDDGGLLEIIATGDDAAGPIDNVFVGVVPRCE